MLVIVKCPEYAAPKIQAFQKIMPGMDRIAPVSVFEKRLFGEGNGFSVLHLKSFYNAENSRDFQK